MTNFTTTRSALTALALALGLGLLAPRDASATECFGCYDDANGQEQCKTVEVEGACTVFTFCKAVGCSTSGAIRPMGLVSPVTPRPKPTPTYRATPRSSGKLLSR